MNVTKFELDESKDLFLTIQGKHPDTILTCSRKEIVCKVSGGSSGGTQRIPISAVAGAATSFKRSEGALGLGIMSFIAAGVAALIFSAFKTTIGCVAFGFICILIYRIKTLVLDIHNNSGNNIKVEFNGFDFDKLEQAAEVISKIATECHSGKSENG